MTITMRLVIIAIRGILLSAAALLVYAILNLVLWLLQNALIVAWKFVDSNPAAALALVVAVLALVVLTTSD